jgi:pimeloyl-ACP methyl ester carboxylesterase
MPIVYSHGIEIHYEVEGTGTPVLLLHSFMSSGRVWRHQVPELATKFQTINVDARGHGRSSRVEQPFSLYEMVDDVTAVLDSLEIEHAVWCGLSVGGMVSLRAALRAPDRVGGLIILGSTSGAESLGRRIRNTTQSIAAQLFGLRPFYRPIARMMFGPSTFDRDPQVPAAWLESLSDVDIPSLAHALGALMTRDDITAELSTILAPALVIVGDEDQLLPPTHSRLLAEHLPSATYREITGAGHLSILEQPASVALEIKRFLEELGEYS